MQLKTGQWRVKSVLLQTVKGWGSKSTSLLTSWTSRQVNSWKVLVSKFYFGEFSSLHLHPGYLWELSSVERTVSLDFAKSLFWSKTPSNIFWKLVLLQSRWLSGLAFGVVYSHWPRTADSVSIWWLPVHRHSACNQWLYRHWWLIFFIYF